MGAEIDMEITPSHIHSFLRALLLLIPTMILSITTDTSKMYHSVRGQDTIKLYVIFNALEVWGNANGRKTLLTHLEDRR